MDDGGLVKTPHPPDGSEEAPIYFSSKNDTRLKQGEILSDLIQTVMDITTLSAEERIVNEKNHPFAIIITQDCDLDQSFEERTDARAGKLPNVLLCEAIPIETFRARLRDINLGGSQDFKVIRQNMNERFHCLQEYLKENDVNGIGLPALGIDFKRYFSIPSNELYKRVNDNEAKRRAALSPIYAQHLSNRFASYLARVALPVNHSIE